MKKKRVIVFGNQQICVDSLNILKKRKDVTVIAVVGCPMPLDVVYKYPSIKKYCLTHKLKYFEPERLDREFFGKLKRMKPDICFSIYYRKIFKPFFLKLAPEGFINIHNSLLPKNRGPVPTLWVLLNGDRYSGLTLHYIDKGVDTGDVISQIKFRVPTKLTGYELNYFFMKKGIVLFRKELSNILKMKNNRKPQEHRNATYYGPFRQSMRIIDWASKTALIVNQVRAFAKPYLGSTASILDKDIVIWSAKKRTTKKHKLIGPGKIMKVYDDFSFLVSTADGYLHVTNYEIQNLGESKIKEVIILGNKFNL